MDYPKISIVTPNYNKAQYLEHTILSVLSQNYPNLEYMIIDGGSTDGSVDIIKKYEKQLTYWVSEPKEGMYHAIKKGFEHSTGEIMAWINSDDMYHPNSLFTVAQIFHDCPQVSWLVGKQAHYDEKNRTVFTANSKYFNHLSFLMHRYQWVQQESTFWRRQLYEKVGGIDVKYRLAGDFDLWMRFSRYEKMYITEALIGGFRHCDGQLSHDICKYQEEVETIIRSECISEEEKKQIKVMNFRNRIIPFLQKLRILQWQRIDYRFMRQFVEEESVHKIFYDFEKKCFFTIAK